MFKKSMVIAAPVLASAAIVAAGLGASTQADASGHKYAGPALTSAKSSPTTKCDAGVQKRVFNRGVSGWIYTGSDDGSIIVPGTIIRVHGPQSGKDVLSVNLSAESYLDSGSQGRVKVLLDGVPMAPSDLNTGSVSYVAGYGSFAQNYCRKIGPGAHSMRVVISDYDGGAAGNYYWELNDPMVHVEQSD